jgi:hypothetical protein
MTSRIDIYDTIREYEARNRVYPVLTQSNFVNQESTDPFAKPTYKEEDTTRLSNFEKYCRAARATKVIVDDQDNIHKGSTYWSQVEFDGFVLPGQGRSKPYCKKWVSWGCNNTSQHPKGQHYAEHEVKTCKTSHCPLCFESWINRQSNRSTKRYSKFAENKQFHFRHIILSPPQEKASKMSHKALKKWLDSVLKIANIKTSSVVFHPFRFHDAEKIQPYISPHFHLIVYGKVTNTTEFHNKSGWIIKNKGDLKTDVDIFNCVRYMLSHAGVKKGTHAIRYLGDISYRKLKIEKEPPKEGCPHCGLPLRIFRIKSSPKSEPPPLDHVGLWESDCFEVVDVYDPNVKIPFYQMRINPKEDEGEYYETMIYSFEEILSLQSSNHEITKRMSAQALITTTSVRLDSFS